MSPDVPSSPDAPGSPDVPGSPDAHGSPDTSGRRPRRRGDDDPVLPRVSRDELDEGWGDERDRGSERDKDWYRRERPPHHG